MLASICIIEHTMTMTLVIYPVTIIAVPICTIVHTMTMTLVIYIVTVVEVPILIGILTPPTFFPMD